MISSYKEQVENREAIYQYFKLSMDAASEGGKEGLKKFVSRVDLVLSCKFSFEDTSLRDDELEAYVYMLKLSESWFSYESLLKTIQENGYKSERPKDKKNINMANSIQDVLRIPKDFCDSKQPFGKPGFFNENKINDGYLEFLLENELSNFGRYLKSIFDIKQDARESVQRYIFYLESSSHGGQKNYLLESYNRLTVGPDIVPVNIMSVAYAVRNQYVHDGEIVESGIEDYKIKCELLKACYNFVINFSLIIATQILIDNQ